MIHCRPIARTLAFAFLFALLLPLAVAAAPVDDKPIDRDAFLEHRRQEAARKEVLTKGLLAAQEKATANQAMYDVHFYDLDLALDPTAQTLSGTVATTATVTGDSIATMDLDLQYDMGISAAMVGGAATTFSRSGDVVTVNLDRMYYSGEDVSVTVTYSGNPAGAAFGWSSAYGESMIWTLSEPFGAREWWPCKDLNSDKADSVSIHCTVPAELVVASNGLLQSDLVIGDLRTFHWKTNYPTATYLISLAIHPYYQYSHWYTPQDGGDPMEVQYFVYDDPTHIADIEANYDLTVPMLDYFSQGYGEYPFVDEKYGHADFVWGGGMEHQTITSLGWWSMDIISHEMAHQWWGDMITCDDFQHIWLNEGFATWSEAYWAEHHNGFETYQQYMALAAYYGPGTIFVEDPLNDNIFSSDLSYNKGSWIVHMLRGVLGDDDFFASLAAYRAQHEYGSATTEQFRDIFESVSGIELDAFFQQWIYGEYFPEYGFGWADGPGAGEITVTIEQVQSNTGLFTMPIDLRVVTDAGTVDVTVQNSLASESYTVTVPGAVTEVILDPEDWILCRINTSVESATLDSGVLVVNGVDWNTYGSEITSAYADSVFWGDHAITFWDCFNEPTAGYPANLPAPLGHGAVPADVIGDYSTVVWVGNNYNGDLAMWSETPIPSYLEAGGNVLLMSRRSYNFLAGDLASYLGVSFSDYDGTLGNCLAVADGLVDIPLTGTQSYNDVYLTTVEAGSELLFRCTSGFSGPRGTGAYVAPPAGGTFRSDGGRLAHIAGRPYRMDHDALRQNVQYILDNLLLEPYEPMSPVPGPGTVTDARVAMQRAYPNPFNPQTVIPFSLPRGTEISLTIYDARGRLVCRVASGAYKQGDHEVVWDGRTDGGRSAASGTYYALLRTSEGEMRTQSLVLLK